MTPGVFFSHFFYPLRRSVEPICFENTSVLVLVLYGRRERGFSTRLGGLEVSSERDPCGSLTLVFLD